MLIDSIVGLNSKFRHLSQNSIVGLNADLCGGIWFEVEAEIRQNRIDQNNVFSIGAWNLLDLPPDNKAGLFPLK